MSGKRRLLYLFLLITVFINLGLAPLWAGDGSGGGKGQPLQVEASLPANGAVGVSNLDALTVTFNKNVVYMTVRENNQKCFSLWREQEAVPVDIIMADDQIEFEKRRDVIIKPRQPLQPGTAYRLEIAPQMESKSGVTLGAKATISFTTAGIAAKNDTETEPQSPGTVTPLPPTEPPTAVESTALPVSVSEKTDINQTDNLVQTTQKVESDNNVAVFDEPAEQPDSSAEKSPKGLFIAGTIAVALVVMGIYYLRKNK